MMNVPALLGLAGLSAGLLSSVLLGLSLGRFNQAVWAALEAHGLALETLVDPTSHVVLFTGLDKHLQRGARSATWMTRGGLFLLALSFLLQGAALVLSVQPSLQGSAWSAMPSVHVTPGQ